MNRVIRKDRLYKFPNSDSVKTRADAAENGVAFFNEQRIDLERMMTYEPGSQIFQSELSAFIQLHQMPVISEEAFREQIFAFLNSDEYIHDNDPVDYCRKKSCLISQLINNVLRENEDLDRYLVFQEEIMVGWSMAAHLYDRLLSDNLYKLSHLRFFTASYMERGLFQVVPGCIVGPVCSGLMMMGLTSQTLLGPLFVVGFCCLPSVAYLVKSVQCVIDAIDLAWNGTCQNQDSLQVNIHLQHALSCLMIALLMPLAWGACFPLEMIRFMTRTTATVIDAVNLCCSPIEPELQPQITAGV